MTATPAWPPKSAPRLFITPPLSAGLSRQIDGDSGHYLAKVMRVAVGDTIILLDNDSGEWAARVDAVGKRDVTVHVAQQLRPRETVPDLWLCAAPVKQRFDMVIEKATELGVARIVPVQTRRTIITKINMAKTEAHIREAAEQCARTALTELSEFVKLADLLSGWPSDRALFFADENGGVPAAAAMRAHTGPAAILVGPEGGFDPAEREAILALPQSVGITLGPRILRAETAAIAASTLWMVSAGDW